MVGAAHMVTSAAALSPALGVQQALGGSAIHNAGMGGGSSGVAPPPPLDSYAIEDDVGLARGGGGGGVGQHASGGSKNGATEVMGEILSRSGDVLPTSVACEAIIQAGSLTRSARRVTSDRNEEQSEALRHAVMDLEKALVELKQQLRPGAPKPLLPSPLQPLPPLDGPRGAGF